MLANHIDVLLEIAKVAGIALGGFLVIEIVLKILKKAMSKSNKVDPSLYRFISNAIAIVLVVILIMMILESLGVRTTGVATVLGVGGAAIALALKDSLGNVAGGIMILITKPFSQGEYVDIEGTTGVVQHIDLLLTTMTTYDNKVVTIPNGRVNTAVITNYSRKDTRRVDMVVGIAWNEDADKAMDVLRKLAAASSLIHKEPAPFTAVAQRQPDAVELDFRVWTATEEYWPVRYYLEDSIKKAFEEEGIRLPQTEVHVHMEENIDRAVDCRG